MAQATVAARARAPTPSGLSPIQAAAQAEARHQRLCALQDMNAGQLRRLLAGDSTTAAPWVEAAARFGIVEAQLRLGRMLLDGAGLIRDEGAAARWFAAAARKGSPDAMNMVGRCHENGWGASTDLALAAHWYRRSAEAGHDWGQYNYANMLFDGRGVAADQAMAVVWYRRAADQGHARAMNLLARCHEEGWGAQRDEVRAFEWYRRSAEGGYFRGQFNYATALVALNRTDEALDWFDAACRDATPESRAGMVALLVQQPDPRLRDLGRRFGKAADQDASA